MGPAYFHRRMSRVDAVLFCLLAGVLATFARAYVFGGPHQQDQLEQFPTLYRLLDPGYLAGDFYVNATDGAQGPRYYYLHMLAALSHAVPLPVLVLLLTVLSHATLAAVTFYAARWLYPQFDLPAVFAVMLVLMVESFDLGRAAMLATAELTPSLLVRGLGLLSLWWALQGRLVGCLAAALLAVPFHPLVGVEMPAIGLMARAWEVLFAASAEGDRQPALSLRKRLVALTPIVGCGVLLAAWAGWLFRAPAGATLTTAEFLRILGHCRAPHHYLPSHFEPRAYALTAVFIAAMGIAWQTLRKIDPQCRVWLAWILRVNIVIAILLAGGWLFVEVLPLRVWITAQTFRMLSVTKWLGFLLLAGVAGRAVAKQRTFAGAAPGWCILMGIGPLQPLAALIGTALDSLRRSVVDREGRRRLNWLCGLGLLLIVSLNTEGLWTESQGLVIIGLSGAWCLLPKRTWLGRLGPVVALVLIGWLLVWERTPNFDLPGVVLRPMATLDDPRAPCHALGCFAREHTSASSLWVLPPEIGNFQLIAQRAVVVQWKTFPFGDRAMVEWLQRMRDCYGEGDESVLPGKEQLAERYRRITPERLARLSRIYGATHAVLPVETPWPAAVLFQDGGYKIVALPFQAK